MLNDKDEIETIALRSNRFKDQRISCALDDQMRLENQRRLLDANENKY